MIPLPIAILIAAVIIFIFVALKTWLQRMAERNRRIAIEQEEDGPTKLRTIYPKQNHISNILKTLGILHNQLHQFAEINTLGIDMPEPLSTEKERIVQVTRLKIIVEQMIATFDYLHEINHKNIITFNRDIENSHLNYAIQQKYPANIEWDNLDSPTRMMLMAAYHEMDKAAKGLPAQIAQILYHIGQETDRKTLGDTLKPMFFIEMVENEAKVHKYTPLEISRGYDISGHRIPNPVTFAYNQLKQELENKK